MRRHLSLAIGVVLFIAAITLIYKVVAPAIVHRWGLGGTVLTLLGILWAAGQIDRYWPPAASAGWDARAVSDESRDKDSCS